MNILMHSYEFPPLGGGGAKVVHGLSTRLVKMGIDIDLVTMKSRGLKTCERVNGVNVHRVPCIRTRQSICYTPEMISYVVAGLPKALKLARKKTFDLNHTHFVFPDGLIAYVIKKLTGLPYIITVHGSDVPGYNPDRFTIQHKLLFPLWRQVVQNATHIVSPSETLLNLMQSQTVRVPITIIPNGLDPLKFQPNREKKNRILVVSRMFARKGTQYFLQALEKLPGTEGYEVNIVGEGPYLGSLKHMAESLPAHVKFWGHLNNNSPELRDLFETSRIFVFPSEAENFPNVLLEAMAAGMAIMTTKTTGCAEVVGDTGILIPPRDAEAILANLVKLMEDENLCRNLGKAARARLEQRFTWDVVASQYKKLYKEFDNASG